MSAPKVDVLAVLDDHADGIELAHKLARGKNRDEIAEGLREYQEARAAVAELIEASTSYFLGWVQDEAADDGEEWTGCSEEQHKAAKRLKGAIARIGGAE